VNLLNNAGFQRAVAVLTLARCSFREVRRSVYEKIFGAQAEQTYMLFLLDDFHNLILQVIAEVSGIADKEAEMDGYQAYTALELLI
jgi:hypothetical protein